ncbi:MAG: CapA family protein [Clostridia bacterium]|nr:CapA family protein [Clostridia bacterium]
MITFLGDVAILNRNVFSEYTPRTPYIFNLEYVVSNGTEKPALNKINICSDFKDFERLFKSNPQAVNIANNHTLDYGIQGFETTLQAMQQKNIATIGGDSVYWLNPKTCILSYTMFNGKTDDISLVDFESEKAKNQIAEARNRGADCVIVLMHWGIENYENSVKSQREIGHMLIDNGADFIVGCHSHCIQPIEMYNEKYICYGLGNCFFNNFNLDSHYNSEGKAAERYRLRWGKWNRKSLAVTFDETVKRVKSVDLLYQKKNTLTLKKANYDVKKLREKNKFLAKIRFFFRKYWLFFKSNSFVDGKIFDFNALGRELRK